MHGVRAALFRLWGRLPTSLRRHVVRLFSPSFTVGANCVIVDRAGTDGAGSEGAGSIVLVRHSYRADWGLPGGLIGRKEEPADAVRRETLEEIGLEIEVDGPPVVIVDAPLQQIDFAFRASPVAGSVAAARSAEILEVAWFAIDALPALQRDARQALVALGIGQPGGAH